MSKIDKEPRKPIEPESHYSKVNKLFTTCTDDDDFISISEVLSQIPTSVDVKNVFIEVLGAYDYGCACDVYEKVISDTEKIKYETAFKKWQEDLVKWKIEHASWSSRAKERKIKSMEERLFKLKNG